MTNSQEQLPGQNEQEASKLKIWAIAMMAPLVLSACTDEMAPGASSQGELAIATETPTDALAQQISDGTNLLRQSYEDDFDISSLPKTANAVLGFEEIVNSSAASEAHGHIVDIAYPISLEDTVHIHDALEALNTVTDTEGNAKIRDYLKTKVISTVMSGVRFGDIEQEEAHSLLSIVDEPLATDLRPDLYALDAMSAIVANYADPEAIKEDLMDIPDDSQAKQLALVLADGSQPDAHSQLSTLNTTAIEMSDKYSAELDGAYASSSDYVYGNNNFRALVSDSIKSHNNIQPEVASSMLPELKDPYATIDLRRVIGSKEFIDVSSDMVSQKEESQKVDGQFGEVYVEDGELKVAFFADANLSEQSKEQLHRLITDANPLLEAAFASGDLLAVRLVIDRDYDPYYANDLREIRMVLGNDNTMSEEQFRGGLTHEVTHALVRSAFKEEDTVTDEEAALVKQACSGLSGAAYEQFSHQLQFQVNENLDALIERTTGDARIGLEALHSAAQEGRLSELVEQSILEYADVKDLNTTSCSAYSFGDVVTTLLKEKGVKDAAVVYDSLLVELAEDEDFKELTLVWSDTIHTYSLFEKLNESSYTRTGSFDKAFLGHSRDNANEMMASVVNMTLNNPSDAKKLIDRLTGTDKEAVLLAIDASYNTISNRHPSLKTYLDNWVNQFVTE